MIRARHVYPRFRLRVAQQYALRLCLCGFASFFICRTDGGRTRGYLKLVLMNGLGAGAGLRLLWWWHHAQSDIATDVLGCQQLRDFFRLPTEVCWLLGITFIYTATSSRTVLALMFVAVPLHILSTWLMSLNFPLDPEGRLLPRSQSAPFFFYAAPAPTANAERGRDPERFLDGGRRRLRRPVFSFGRRAVGRSPPRQWFAREREKDPRLG